MDMIKTDKKIITITSALLIIMVFTFFSSCVPDDVGPQSGGSVDPVEKFLGTWHVNDQSNRLNYNVVITRHTTQPKTKVRLSNFADLGGRIEGDVVGNTIIITNQLIGNSNYIIKDGTGTFVNAARIDFNYTLDDGINTKVRNAVFTK